MTGIYRATPVRVNPRHRNVKSVYKVHIDVVHFKKSDKKRLHESDPDSGVRFTQERINELTTLSQIPDIYDRLSKALGKVAILVRRTHSRLVADVSLANMLTPKNISAKWRFLRAFAPFEEF